MDSEDESEEDDEGEEGGGPGSWFPRHLDLRSDMANVSVCTECEPCVPLP